MSGARIVVDGRPAPTRIEATAALTFMTRLRGWMGRSRTAAGPAIWLEPCNAVHTAGMRFPIDVVYVAPDGSVQEVREHVRPWRATRPVRGARAVIELPAGMARTYGLAPGGHVKLIDDTMARAARGAGSDVASSPNLDG